MSDSKTTEQQPFAAMILAKRKELADAYDADNEPRLRQAVTMEYRWRGNYFGTFNNNKNYRLEWVGKLGKGLVTYPVIPRAIRSKMSTSLATEVKIDCHPARNLPEIEAGAELAQNLAKRFDERIWDEDFEINSCHLRQTQRLCYARIFNNRRKGVRYQEQVASEETAEVEVHGDVYACGDCGQEVGAEDLASKPFALPMPENGEFQFNAPPEKPDEPECPQCGAKKFAKIKDAVSDSINPFKTVTRRTGEPDTDIISALLVRCDDISGVGLQFEKLKWFNVNEPVPRLELELQFPNAKTELGTPRFEKWSPGTHWWYALTKEEGNYHYAGGLGESYKKNLKNYHELEKWYFTPEQCLGWKSPGDFKLETECTADNPEPSFTIQTDETIEEAMLRNFEAEEFLGMCVWIANDVLLKVEHTDFRTPSADDDVSYRPIGWMISATSYFPLGEERLLNLQDAITNVLSMVYSASLKRSLAALVYNSEFIDPDEIRKNHTGGFIAAKHDSGVDLTKINLKNQAFYLEPPQLDQMVWQLAELIIQIQKEESGVYDEVVGAQNAANVTKGGRELAANQGLAQMLSPSKAKRRAKIDILKMYLKIWQTLPEQAFQMVKGSFNEEWKPSDIEAFKKLDIESDMQFFVVEGTDVPVATPDTQSKLMAVFNMGLLLPTNPLPVDFTIKLLRALGVEYDVQNSDASRRLAAKRLKLIKQKIVEKDLSIQNSFVVIEEPAGQPDPATGIQPTIARRVLNPQVLMDVMSDTRLQARETENHLVQMEYYGDALNGELGRETPNEVLMEFIDQMIRQHLGTMNNIQAREAATQGQIEGTNRAVADETHRALTGADEKEAAAAEMASAENDRMANREIDQASSQRAFDAEEKDKARRHDLQKTLISVHAKEAGAKNKN
jgi:DNA-directed RNA polymerase subunit RPC12/RpoP